MHRARIDEDYETALAAGAQATANAQLIGAAKEQQEAASAARAFTDAVKPVTPSPTYLIALKDHTVETATNYWTDGRMLHYMTRQGAHVQVRLDLVDLDLSTRLNREINLEFHLTK
jgi:multidrug efflux pump subunit AcrA (membrane-fusion protein)